MAQQQINEFLNSLNESNKRIWDEWSKALQGNKLAVGGEAMDKLYHQNLDMTERLIKDTLKAESSWLDQWLEGVKKTPNAPEPLLALMESMHKTMKTMLEHRTQMWEGWLAQARSMNFDKMPNVLIGPETQQTVMKAWEDFYRQATEAQQRLMGDLGKPAPAKKPAANKA